MKKYGLLGEKLGHSWSVSIHNHIFKEINVDASYDLLECEEIELPKYIDLLKKGIYSGFNVTIPYKKSIMKYLDYVDDNAAVIGSVNTVALINGKVCGYNTDYLGFIAELKFYNIDVFGKKVFILGTGGAAVAVYKALLDLKVEPIFVSRNPHDEVIGYDELANQEIDILVNTTPVGMYPNIMKSPVDEKIAKRANKVIDLIFNPLETKLLKDAGSLYNGLYMLVSQAVEAEKIWQARDLEIDVQLILEKIIREKNL